MHFSDTKDTILKIDALISHFLHIPFPEELPDTQWAEKWAQVKYLADKGILGNLTEKNLF